MKKLFLATALSIGLICAPLVNSQTNPPPEPGGSPVGNENPVGGGAPLGGGLITLILAASAYSIFRLRKNSRNK